MEVKRDFRSPIFMGNGDASLGNCYKLIKRLEEGFSLHSGLQQGQGHMSNEEMERGKLAIVAVIQDINMALGNNASVIKKTKDEI